MTCPPTPVRSLRPWGRVVALVLCALPLAGCGLAARLAVGPTIDTTGGVGCNVKVSVGPLFDGPISIAVLGRGGGGAADKTAPHGETLGAVEAAVIVASDSGPSGYIGGYFTWREVLRSDGPAYRLYGGGADIGVLGDLARDSRPGVKRFWMLGGEASFEYVAGEGQDRGIFMPSLVTQAWGWSHL